MRTFVSTGCWHLLYSILLLLLLFSKRASHDQVDVFPAEILDVEICSQKLRPAKFLSHISEVPVLVLLGPVIASFHR